MITAFTLGLSVQMQTETSNLVISGIERRRPSYVNLRQGMSYKTTFEMWKAASILIL